MFFKTNGGNMSILKPITEKKAKGKVKKIYEDIKSKRKITKIPNFWKSLANDPDTLERTWNSLQQVMEKGALDPLTKEMLYVAVSMTNSCEYCIHTHTAAARAKGMTDEQYAEFLSIVSLAGRTNHLLNGIKVPIDPEFDHENKD